MTSTQESVCKTRPWANRSWKRHLIEVAVMMLVLGPAMLLLTCDVCYDNWELGIASSLYSGLTWVFLWKGNELGADWLDYHLNWLDAPVKRFVASVLYTVIYTLLAVGVLHFFFFTLYLGRDFFDSYLSNLEGNTKVPIIITFIISGFMHSRGFLLSWRNSAVDVEKLKREQLSSQYESLKKQIDPHFLFNSLNTLTSLVHKDANLSEKYIKKLSEVYRYVLDSQEHEVVDLKEELAFAQSYVFLQQIRHGKSLQITIDIPEDQLARQVPPFSLQMLIENAIKHNVVSEAKPLEIRVSAHDGYLRVANNLQMRNSVENSKGLGINNIKMRYEYLSGKEIKVNDHNGEFKVDIPLLDLV